MESHRGRIAFVVELSVRGGTKKKLVEFSDSGARSFGREGISGYCKSTEGLEATIEANGLEGKMFPLKMMLLM